MKLNKTQWLSVGWWGLLLSFGLYLLSQSVGWVHWAWLYTVGVSEVLAFVITNHLPLSPIIQWIDDRGSDTARWYQGFRALAVTIAAYIGGMTVWIVSSVSPLYVAGPLGVGVFLWLLYHWTRPEAYDQ